MISSLRKHIFSCFTWISLSVFLLGGCQTTSPKNTIAVSGAFALYPLMVQWADEYQKLYPDIRVDVTAGGAGKGITDTLSGAVDIGMVSREVKPEETSQGAFAIAVTKDAVFPMFSSNNPYKERILKQGISKDQFRAIFITGDLKTWGQVLGDSSIKDEIHVYTRSDAAGAAEMWSKFMGGKSQEDIKGIGVTGDPGLLDAVIKDPLGIGFNNLGYAFDASTGKPPEGALVMPVDLNQNKQVDPDEIYQVKDDAIKAILDNIYPSPPGRDLYLVTKGKPTGITSKFINWILNDGQKYVSEAGYIKLPDSQMAAEKNKLN
jgi:phosphate transport system substrate-binding protein